MVGSGGWEVARPGARDIVKGPWKGEPGQELPGVLVTGYQLVDTIAMTSSEPSFNNQLIRPMPVLTHEPRTLAVFDFLRSR